MIKFLVLKKTREKKKKRRVQVEHNRRNQASEGDSELDLTLNTKIHFPKENDITFNVDYRSSLLYGTNYHFT